MIYLLDVNVLIGLGVDSHSWHEQVAHWLRSLDPRSNSLASCSITELGFVRILSLPGGANLSVGEAQVLLRRVKKTSPLPFSFLTDSLLADDLPAWVLRSNQTTDGHLLSLAEANQASLATFDRKIPGAFQIPR